MFCTTLRRRSSFASIVPSLTSPTTLSLKESNLSTHDIAIPLSSSNSRTLRLLLLSPTAITPPNLDHTISRTQHFASLTGGTDIAIIFTLTAPKPFVTAKSLATPIEGNELNAYTTLQSKLLVCGDIPWIPILPLSKPEGMADLIKSHVQAVARQTSEVVPAIRGTDLLASCTTDAGLSGFAVGLASDVFSGFEEFACAGAGFVASGEVRDEGGGWDDSDEIVSSEGPKTGFGVLEEQLGKDVVSGMLEFWADDWVID